MVLAVVLTMTLAAGSGVYAAYVNLALIPTDNIHDDDNLNSPNGIATFESGGHTYAAVAAGDGDNVQILNITNPSNITLAGNIKDDIDSTRVFKGARNIAIFESGNHTYAAVTGATDDGVQILNITNPSNVTAAGSITKGSNVKLDNPRGIATFESGNHTYAAVAAYTSDAVQILNITNPSNVTAAGSIADNVNLDGISNIATFESGGHTYAAVAAYTSDAVQILDLTDPYNVTAAGSIPNDSNLHLGGPDALATFESGGSTYAAVTADDDYAVQILDVTDPTAITAAGSITNNTKLVDLEDIVIFKSEGHTYAAVAAHDTDAVHILDLTNLTAITIVDSITHDGGDILLDGARSIATFESGGHTHIAVTSFLNTVQIIKVEITIPDTTPPVLTLTGDASVITPMDAPYDDAGATCVDVVDGTEVSLTPTLTSTAVDTGTAGEYTVTYSCSDNANPAVEVSRIVTVQPPVSLIPTASITNGTDAKLAGAHAITIFGSGNYAAVAAKDSNAVQILDISDPDNIRPAGSITDDADLVLEGARDIAIYDSGISAAVAAFDEGVQILDISDRDNITAVNNTSHNHALDLYGTHAIATFTSGSDRYAAVATYDGFHLLDITASANITAVDKDPDFPNLNFGDVDDIAIFESGGDRYAAVTVSLEDAVYLLDITNPSNITVAGSITDSTDLVLGGAQALDIFEPGGYRYAAVVAPLDGGNEIVSGIQILDITDPTDITAAGNITDSTDLALDGAQDIVTFKSGRDWYAAVAAKDDSGVQILDITNPFSIAPVGRITDDNSLNLEGAQAIDTFTSGGDRYVAVAAAGDDAVQILKIDITPPGSTPPGSTPPGSTPPWQHAAWQHAA